VLSGAHLTVFPRVMEILKERGIDDIVVFGGGVIPDRDVETLKQAGLAEIFTPGTSLNDIAEWVRNNLHNDE
ncbi:MAG TPA: methylmalonyl-CoA mutase, partial [Actinobacteria bacterium]|nr:methylmalonyl-CoA mutase [Actinomycetota bacterium]